MILSCSYFLKNLSLNVLINMVLIKQKACKPFEPQGASSEPKFDQFELQVEPIGPYDALSPNFVNLSSILAHWRSKLAK